MFRLPALPYAHDALEPHISAETMKTHHGKHHKKYVDTLNDLVADTDIADLDLEAVIHATAGDENADQTKIFNNAAQCWNHEFFWSCLTPNGGAEPTGTLLEMIESDFGSYNAFEKEFTERATGHFGSGWAWLVCSETGLEIMTTHDADLPLVHGKTALITCDLWEHAYYLDYKNERPKYLKVFLDELANWRFAEENLASAQKSRVTEMSN
jgi:Fe-Mn family superoxide dismutase